jgi:hypothetical protein
MQVIFHFYASIKRFLKWHIICNICNTVKFDNFKIGVSNHEQWKFEAYKISYNKYAAN